jgi:hypothetical protein
MTPACGRLDTPAVRRCDDHPADDFSICDVVVIALDRHRDMPHDVPEVPQHREDAVLGVRARLICTVNAIRDLNLH